MRSRGDIWTSIRIVEQLFGYSRQEFVGQNSANEAARDTPGSGLLIKRAYRQPPGFPTSVLRTKGASGALTTGPVCWAEEPPGPRQRLEYYRLAPPVDDR